MNFNSLTSRIPGSEFQAVSHGVSHSLGDSASPETFGTVVFFSAKGSPNKGMPRNRRVSTLNVSQNGGGLQVIGFL